MTHRVLECDVTLGITESGTMLHTLKASVSHGPNTKTVLLAPPPVDHVRFACVPDEHLSAFNKQLASNTLSAPKRSKSSIATPHFQGLFAEHLRHHLCLCLHKAHGGFKGHLVKQLYDEINPFCVSFLEDLFFSSTSRLLLAVYTGMFCERERTSFDILFPHLESYLFYGQADINYSPLYASCELGDCPILISVFLLHALFVDTKRMQAFVSKEHTKLQGRAESFTLHYCTIRQAEILEECFSSSKDSLYMTRELGQHWGVQGRFHLILEFVPPIFLLFLLRLSLASLFPLKCTYDTACDISRWTTFIFGDKFNGKQLAADLAKATDNSLDKIAGIGTTHTLDDSIPSFVLPSDIATMNQGLQRRISEDTTLVAHHITVDDVLEWNRRWITLGPYYCFKRLLQELTHSIPGTLVDLSTKQTPVVDLMLLIPDDAYAISTPSPTVNTPVLPTFGSENSKVVTVPALPTFGSENSSAWGSFLRFWERKAADGLGHWPILYHGFLAGAKAVLSRAPFLVLNKCNTLTSNHVVPRMEQLAHLSHLRNVRAVKSANTRRDKQKAIALATHKHTLSNMKGWQLTTVPDGR